MRTHLARLLLVLAVAAATAAVPLAAGAEEPPLRVLVYSATYGFRHGSITTGDAQFAKLGAESAEFDVDVTEDPSRISAEGLAGYDVVVFLNATGEHPFGESQRAAFMDFLGRGGGFVATHASADGNYYWSEYTNVLGALFLAHPHTGNATNTIEDRTSPLSRAFSSAATFDINEEYYRFQLDPRPNVHVLTSLNKSSAGAAGNTYVDQQPTTWCQEVAGGRSFYTAWGHFDASYTNPKVWDMLVQGVRWAGGRLDADCAPTQPVAAGTIQAEDAAQISFGQRETSNEEGAEEVVTRLLTSGYLQFEDVDLTGVTSLELRVAAETMPEPRPYHVPVSTPALGGTVEVVLDSLKTATNTNTPASATFTVAGQDRGWKTVTVNLPAGVTGVHDVYLRVVNSAANAMATSRIVAPEPTDAAYLMSIDWLRAVR